MESRSEEQEGVDPGSTYDAFAPTFDEFNARYQFRRWTQKLLETAEAGGLRGKRLLDVGCGTGLSFVLPLERGFEVTGVDISAAMLARAEGRTEGRARLLEADMRELPTLGEFDLVWSLNDAMNYLMDEDELVAALAGMRRNLAPDGVVLFDLNTLTQYRGFWSERLVVEGEDGRRFVWNGLAEDVRKGGVYESSYEGSGEGVEPHRHRQRHFPVVQVLAAIGTARLRTVAVLGEHEGELSRGVDEDFHTKAIYICQARPDDGPGEGGISQDPPG
jgi:SAM-dependent methyltransferase